MSRRTCKLPSWLPVDPYILALLGTVGLAALLPASRRPRPTSRAAPRPEPSRSSSSCTAPGCRPARRWTGCGTGGCMSPSWPARSCCSRCSAWPRRGLVPFVLTPHALQRAALPLPGALHRPVVDRVHLDRPRQRSRRDLRGLVLQPRRDRASPRCWRRACSAAAAAASPRTRSLKIVLQLLVPFLAGQLLRRWIGGFVARHKKVLGLRRPRLDPARRLHRVQRGHGRAASGTR